MTFLHTTTHNGEKFILNALSWRCSLSLKSGATESTSTGLLLEKNLKNSHAKLFPHDAISLDHFHTRDIDKSRQKKREAMTSFSPCNFKGGGAEEETTGIIVPDNCTTSLSFS